jgi:hypothetical protein
VAPHAGGASRARPFPLGAAGDGVGAGARPERAFGRLGRALRRPVDAKWPGAASAAGVARACRPPTGAGRPSAGNRGAPAGRGALGGRGARGPGAVRPLECPRRGAGPVPPRGPPRRTLSQRGAALGGSPVLDRFAGSAECPALPRPSAARPQGPGHLRLQPRVLHRLRDQGDGQGAPLRAGLLPSSLLARQPGLAEKPLRPGRGAGGHPGRHPRLRHRPARLGRPGARLGPGILPPASGDGRLRGCRLHAAGAPGGARGRGGAGRRGQAAPLPHGRRRHLPARRGGL